MTSLSKIFERAGIKGRLYIAWGCLLAAFVLILMVVIRGGQNTSKNLHHLRDIDSYTLRVVELGQFVEELHRNVQTYSYTGHKALADRVTTLLRHTESFLEEVHHSSTASESKELVARMQYHFGRYKETFGNVVEERVLRNRLVHEDAPRTREAIVRKLNEWTQHISPHIVTPLIQAVTEIENNLLNYLEEPHANLITQTRARYEHLRGRLLYANEYPANRAEVIALLDDYYRQFMRVTSATRGYLYLISVVMAGEAMELMYVTNKLRDNTLAAQDKLAQAVFAHSESTQTRTTLITVIAVILGILFSWNIAASITHPLVAISETFQRLAAGDLDAVIPGVERLDEIGIMAQAAAVFQQKNKQTQNLLDRSQRLTAQLDASKRELQRSNDELEQFVYTVSHDLKSPIVTSMGFIGMMKDLVSRQEYETAFTKLATLENANRRMSQLVDDLLDLSRVGRVNKEMTTLNMERLIKNLVTLPQRIFGRG